MKSCLLYKLTTPKVALIIHKNGTRVSAGNWLFVKWKRQDIIKQAIRVITPLFRSAIQKAPNLVKTFENLFSAQTNSTTQAGWDTIFSCEIRDHVWGNIFEELRHDSFQNWFPFYFYCYLTPTNIYMPSLLCNWIILISHVPTYLFIPTGKYYEKFAIEIFALKRQPRKYFLVFIKRVLVRMILLCMCVQKNWQKFQKKKKKSSRSVLTYGKIL